MRAGAHRRRRGVCAASGELGARECVQHYDALSCVALFLCVAAELYEVSHIYDVTNVNELYEAMSFLCNAIEISRRIVWIILLPSFWFLQSPISR